MKRYTMTPHLWFLTALGLVGVTLLNLQVWVTSWHSWVALSGGLMLGYALGSLLSIWRRGQLRVIDAVRARELRELERRPYQQMGVWWHMGRMDKTGQVIEIPRPAWEQFACANCGDCHRPEVECYCGCRNWQKGEDI